MEKWLGKYSNVFYALMRIIAGGLYACHGAQKLFGVFGGPKQGAGLLLAAGIIEFVGGILIAVGFLTSIVAFVCSGQKAAAYFMAHAPKAAWPIMNGGEMAVLFCFVFLYIASVGSGILSIDALIRKAKQR